MRSDALIAFVPIGAPLSLVSGNNVAVQSNVIDLLGQGVGQAPANIIGNATVFGQDPGIGQFRPEIDAAVGTALAGSTSINMQLQYAVDSGVGGGYQPGTWNTIAETGAIAIANLTANTVFGRLPFLPAFPAGTLDLFATMAEMMLFPPHLGKGTSGITKTDAKNDPAPGIRPVFYTNRTGRHWMDVQAMRDRNVLLRLEDYAGRVTDNYRGIPVKISDQLLNTEARVT